MNSSVLGVVRYKLCNQIIFSSNSCFFK